MMALSGSARVRPEDPCPEYTLLTEKIAYVIVAKSSSQLVPLAEATTFRIQDKQLYIRTDDANHETRFTIRAMMLRADWEREQQRGDQEMTAVARHDEEREIDGRNSH